MLRHLNLEYICSYIIVIISSDNGSNDFNISPKIYITGSKTYGLCK